ncbi:MAG: VOC family protein [Anaerolineae bacterium]|nr:VOC family protein [Anaerolineae bacterium]
MKFEHLAINVPDAAAMAHWYVEQCEMQVVRGLERPPFTHFLADSTGRTVLELYSNPVAPVPDYAAQHPLYLHVAFAVGDIISIKEHLIAAGATVFSDDHLDDGTHLMMLRDPWGVALQLCQRSTPLP